MTAEADFSSQTAETAAQGTLEVASAKRAAHTAWIVLWLAFFTWCLLVVLVAGALLTFRATATEPQWASLSGARGLVSYQPNSGAEPRLVARDRVNVLDGTLVQTGPNSRASIELFDGSRVELLSDAQVGLDAMRRGRFDSASTSLDLSLRRGAALVTVSGALPTEQVALSLGEAQARLSRGEYLLWAKPEAWLISAYAGRADLLQGTSTAVVTGGQRAVLRAGAPITTGLPLEENLLVNGEFSQGLHGWKPLDDLEVQADALGERRLVPLKSEDGDAVALRLTRTTRLNRHNKTGVIQEVNQGVRGFRSLKLRAKVRLLSSSLDGGGYAGTEYPLTFVVYYMDDRGGEPNWVHGFYYKNAERRPTQFGELITRDEWHEYEVELMEQPDRPAFIKSVWIFGAGHSFDAMVTDLQLVAS